MSRNANWDKAKLQAVGIYRKASPQASINHGEAQYSGGDYRAPEASKACYLGKLQVPDYDTSKVVRCKPFQKSNGAMVRPSYQKRSNSCPQERATLTASGCRASVPNMKALVSWDSYTQGASALIKRRA